MAGSVSNFNEALASAGLKMVSGIHTMLSAADTVVTGLTTVTKVIAQLDTDPVLTCDRANATIGDQAGSPVAGSIILKAWMPTAVGDATPVAATGFAAKKVSWVAFGT